MALETRATCSAIELIRDLQPIFREQRGIYVHYEGADIPSQRVVYIGQAGSGQRDLFHRLRDHANDDLWNCWQRFSWFGFLAVDAARTLVHRRKQAIGNIDFVVALDQMEAITMAILEPLKNRQHPKWKEANEYFQLQQGHASRSLDGHARQDARTS